MNEAKTTTRIDAENVEEIEFHVGMRAKEYEEQGLDPAEARRRSLGRFGDPDEVERRIRAARTAPARRQRWLRAGLALAGVVLVVCVLALAGVFDEAWRAATGSYPKLAPYAAIRWVETTPEVRLDGTWYRLLDVDRVPAAEIVAFCRERWPRIWKKRFEEDLVEAMCRMGHTPGDEVDLALADPSTGERTLKKDVPMTRSNRQRIWRAADNGRRR